jgi:hypothetical protein
MPRTRQAVTLQMYWCLDCHRAPKRYVRPRSEVFNMAWQPPADQLERGRELIKACGISRHTDCSTCHR